MALMAVADALQRVLADARPLPAETVALDEALGRVLTDDVIALRTQPPAALSAMDGYAVRASDVAQAPVTLKVIGEVAAGHPFAGKVGPGEAARIFTGGVMPAGSDTVVIQEFTTQDVGRVAIQKATTAGRNVRAAGIDFARDQNLLRRGHRLTDRDLMLAAAMNHPRLRVHRRPKVAVLGTGDELVPPGSAPQEGEIVFSNGFALAALATEGLELSFWRVALRPGRPMMHGRLEGMQVLGVPGNPVSSYVCSFLFLVPLIRTLAGRKDIAHQPENARLGTNLPANDERADYLRAILQAGPNGPLVTPLPAQDSSLMAPLAKADCLLIREPYAPAALAGSDCIILRLGL